MPTYLAITTLASCVGCAGSLANRYSFWSGLYPEAEQEVVDEAVSKVKKICSEEASRNELSAFPFVDHHAAVF